MARKINFVYLVPWMIVVSIGMFQFGYSIAMFNIFTKVLFKQYDQDGGAVLKNQDDFNSFVTTVIPVGACVGSLTGGILCGYGRRMAIFIVNVFLIAGAGITMIFNFWALVAGRLLIGYAAGSFTVIAPLFISETSPAEVAGSLGAINQFMVTAGIMVADILGFIVPYEYKEGSDTILNPDVYTTKVWRVVFIIPGCMAVLQTILVLFVFRSDTPKYYKQNNMIDQVSSVNALIYKGELTSSGRPAQNNSGAPSSEVNRSVLDDEDKQVEAKVPISALFTPRYRMAFTIGCCLAIFQQLTGINAVIFYSGDIFTRGKVGYDSEHSGKIGTMLVGVVNWAAAMIAIPLLTRLGRKFLLISGQIAMGASLLLLGIFAITDSTTAIIVFTLCFVAFFEFSIGPILWLYAAEIMTESGMAAASLITWIVTIIFGLFTSKLFDALTAEGMYFTFTGIDVVGLLFILFLIKETKGKSKEEIQYLYCDEKYYPLQNEKRDP